ncbi:MAG: glycosyl hydrolase family 39 [Chitinophagaceae bacterium]
MNSIFLSSFIYRLPVLFLILFCQYYSVFSQTNKIVIDWNNTVRVSKTTPTLQVVVNPMLRTKAPIHKDSFKALKEIGADYVRFVPWFPYPKLGVAELEPPAQDKTFWDFSLIDPLVIDFMEATKGHSVVMNFSTIPVWMFKTEKPVSYPDDPNVIGWEYNQGKEFRDTTLKELTDYYVRLFSWYTKGGFTDELGKLHQSGHYFNIPYWEVFNEPEYEHEMSPQLYTKCYDAIVTALKKISPATKFIGITLALTTDTEFYEYFLNPNNHQKDIPLEGISYHFYAFGAGRGQTIDQQQYSFFDQANGFIDKVRYIEHMRKRLAPETFTTVNEIGSILTNHDHKDPISPLYWNLSGAMFAYIYLELAKLGVDVAGESQLVGYPTQYPDVSMINWVNGNPNARYWVLKLLIDQFKAGDELVKTTGMDRPNSDAAAQAFLTKKGRKLLLINKRNRNITLELPKETGGSKINSVNVLTGEKQASQSYLTGNKITLKPFSVNVLEIKN